LAAVRDDRTGVFEHAYGVVLTSQGCGGGQEKILCRGRTNRGSS
jgi:hypothetical protein